MIPEAHNPETLLSEPGITRGIALTTVMLTTIGFDDQPGTKMNEIDDIGTEGLLAAKLVARQAGATKLAP